MGLCILSWFWRGLGVTLRLENEQGSDSVRFSIGYITFYHQDQKVFGPLKLSTPVFSLRGLCLGLSPVSHGG